MTILLLAPLASSDLLSLLLALLVLLIIAGLIFWAVNKLSAAFGIPVPIVAVVQVGLVIILVLLFLGMLFGALPVRL